MSHGPEMGSDGVDYLASTCTTITERSQLDLNDGNYDGSQDGIDRSVALPFPRRLAGHKWACPVCHRDGWWVTSAKELSWAVHGGGISVCTRCEKTRKDEIDKHNAMFYGSKKADPDCDHNWTEPYRGRFYCDKCGTSWNWMCGCGGSMYVCDQHYKQFMEENAPVERFLSANAR